MKYRILWYKTEFAESYVEANDEEQAIEKAHNNLDTELVEVGEEGEYNIVELQEVNEIPEAEAGE